MDLTQLSDDEVQALANMGNFAALAEINRRSSLPTAIEKDFIRDKQGNIQLVDFPQDDLMNYNEFYDMPIEQNRGILQVIKDAGGNVLDFITSGGFIGQGIRSLGNFLGDTFKGSRFYNPRSPVSGERIFAPGSRAGDAVGLDFRRDANRFANMLNRLSQGKKIGRSNLAKIMGPTRLDLPGVNVDEMAKSIQESSETGYGGFGSASAAAEAAATSGGRDYSESPGAMAGDMEYGEE